VVTETSSETTPEESPPGSDGGTQGVDASEGRARDTEPTHVYLGDQRTTHSTGSLIDSVDELSLIKEDIEDDSDYEFSAVPMPLSAPQPASYSGTFPRGHHPEMLSPQTSGQFISGPQMSGHFIKGRQPEMSEPMHGSVPNHGSLLPGRQPEMSRLPGRQPEMSRPKPHSPARSRPMPGLISGLYNLLPNGMPLLPGFIPGGTKRRAPSLGLPSSREFWVQDSDSSMEPAKFPNMLVAISGSPSFEKDMVATLKKIGLPEKQAVRFEASTVPL
jgi:hypothetical protein